MDFSDRTYLDHDGEVWLGALPAKERFDLSPNVLCYARTHRQAALDGKKLRHKPKRFPTYSRGPVFIYPESELKRLSKAEWPEGNWPTAPAIERQDNIRLADLHRWRKNPCPHLDGRRIRAKKVRPRLARRGSGTPPAWVFDPTDIATIVKRRKELSGGLHVDGEGKVWLDARLAKESYEISRCKLHYSRKHPRLCLGGKTLKFKRLPVKTASAGSHRVCFLYPEVELQRLSGKASPQRDDIHRDAAGEWLPTRTVTERFGYTAPQLFDWQVNGCPHLEGKKPRHKLIRLQTARGYLSQVWCFHVEDLERIKRARSGGGADGTATAAAGSSGQTVRESAATAGASANQPADPPVPGNGRPAATGNEDRDRWIYQQCCERVKYPAVAARLRKKRKWEPIDSTNGIKSAAARYAGRHGLPPIPGRQPGRQSQ